MGKAGQTWNGARISDDSEAYVARLFRLERIRNGNRRPDFISSNGSYSTQWSLELKSTSGDKCLIENYQLLYGYTSPAEYMRFFGRSLVTDAGFLPELANAHPDVLFGADRRVHYQDIMKRSDKTPVGTLFFQKDSVHLSYGDHYLVPQDLVFYFFAIGMAMRTGQRVRKCVRDLKSFVSEHAAGRLSLNFADIKEDVNSFQNLNLGDIRYLMKHTKRLKTQKARKRVESLRRLLPEVRDWVYIQLDGPCETKVHVLCPPEERSLFEEQVKGTLAETSPELSRIAEERRRVVELINSGTNRDEVKKLGERYLLKLARWET